MKKLIESRETGVMTDTNVTGDNMTEEGPEGEGDEKFEDKVYKENTQQTEGFQGMGKGKGETVQKRKRPVSERKCPHNHQRRECRTCDVVGICDHNHLRR